MSKHSSEWHGWRAAFGCTQQALVCFRIVLGSFLTLELLLRFRFLHPFYSEQGTLPLSLLMPKVDTLYSVVCVGYCHLYKLWQVQALLACQVVLAVLFTLGKYLRVVTPLSWLLYLSLTLRNTWLNYILDRYFHYLLFFSMILPLTNDKKGLSYIHVSPATIGFKLMILWIYFDAGWGKYTDVLQGWSYNAQPLPALDTYARHTTFARYLYAILGPEGLRIMTPTVVYVELLAAPIALLGSYIGSKVLTNTGVALILSMHVGIALSLRNSALLQIVAGTAWILFMPLGTRTSGSKIDGTSSSSTASQSKTRNIIALALVIAMFIGNIWFELFSRDCDQSVKHIWSPLLHNRWNVFVGAEEYVSWEIAPGLVKDKNYDTESVVDVWGKRDYVTWSIPGGGAPCTATARPGRWRSFPYLADLDGADGEVLWDYLCWEYDSIHTAENKTLVKYNFFMLQADVLPNMGFGPTRKRLIKSHTCKNHASEENEQEIVEHHKDDRENSDEL